MTISLSTPVIAVVFPTGTQDTLWTFNLTGTAPDGTPYSFSVAGTESTVLGPSDLQVGTVVTLTVEKNGISSMVSDPYTVSTAPFTLFVPDAAQKAVIAAA